MLDLKKLEEKLNNALEAESEQTLTKWLLGKAMNEEKIEDLEKRIRNLERSVFSLHRPSKYKEGDEVKVEHWGKEFTGVVTEAFPESGSGLIGTGINNLLWKYEIRINGTNEYIILKEYDLEKMNN